jgi:hypothetical protein
MRGATSRRLLAAAAALAACALAPVHVHATCGTYSCGPVLASVSPQQLVLDGKPLHITLQGHNLSGVTAVTVAPMAAAQGWSAFNDQTLLVTLPATMAPGIYSVRVLSPEGGSDPSMAPQFQVFPAAPPAPPPAPRAKATPKPTPVPTPPLPQTGVAGLVMPAPPAPPGGLPPGAVLTAGGAEAVAPSAPVAIMVGLAGGALLYLLWGNPRRLAGSWRSEPLHHLVGRPAQALRIGSVCLYCGRMHFILLTRRDLWRARKYCRPRCFISAEATPSPLGAEDMRDNLPRRMRRGAT